MNITFLGVGEACDPAYPNTSILIDGAGAGGRDQLLLDCGFTTPHLYFAHCQDPDALGALWISHFHGDHFFGVPLLLLKLWELERRRSLAVFGPAGVEKKILQAFDLAYPSFAEKLRYTLDFHALEPGVPANAAGYLWQTAENSHSQRSLSVRITAGGKSVMFSGDGRPTSASKELAAGCGLVIHEAYRVHGDTPGHGSIRGCLALAEEAGVKNLALLHVACTDRHLHLKEIKRMLCEKKNINAFLPEPGSVFTL